MGKDLAVGVAALAIVIGLPLARSLRSGDNTAFSVAALIYIVGIGQAFLVLLDPAFEHGGYPSGSAHYPTYNPILVPTPTSLHNHVSQTINAAILLLLFLVLLRRILARNAMAVRPWAIGLLSFTFILVISAVVNRAWNVRELLLPAAVFVATRPTMAMDSVTQHLRYTLRFITITSLILFFVSRSDVLMDFQGRTLFGYSQMAGLTPHPNAMGALAAASIALELAILPPGWFDMRRRFRSAISAIPIACSAACCALAQSHGGWIEAAIAVVVIRAHVRHPRFGPMFWTYLFGIAAAFVLLEQHLSHLINGGLNGRVTIWTQAYAVFRQSPIIGSGPNGLQTRVDMGLLITAATQAHNLFLEALAYTGILGLAGLALFVLDSWRRSLALRKAAGALPLALFLVLLVDMLVESPMMSVSIMPLGVVAVLATQMAPVNTKRSATPALEARKFGIRSSRPILSQIKTG